MNFQNEMKRKLDVNNNSENGITWECLAMVIQETGKQIVSFKEKEGLNPCFDGHGEEVVQYQYKNSIMEYSGQIARAGNASEKGRLLQKRGNE